MEDREVLISGKRYLGSVPLAAVNSAEGLQNGCLPNNNALIIICLTDTNM